MTGPMPSGAAGPAGLGPDAAERLPGLCAQWRAAAALDAPVDRAATEAVLAAMYARLGVPLPPVLWVDSPGAAAEALRRAGAGETLPAPEPSRGPRPLFAPRVDAMPGDAWLTDALGWILGEAVEPSAVQAVADGLGLALDSWYAPPVEMCHGYAAQSSLAQSVRAAVGDGYEAWTVALWVGFYDVVRRLGLVGYGPWRDAELDLLTALARSGAGWWWPCRELCVVARRPVAVATEEVPGPRGGARLHRADGPALTFADGWRRYVWHGVPVPADLVEDGWALPRILAEPSLEVRRCAIERLGWARFIEAAGLRPMGPPAPDPGHPGRTLALYDVPKGTVGWTTTRLLLCTDAGPERDGTRRRFAVEVPAHHTDPVQAAATLPG